MLVRNARQLAQCNATQLALSHAVGRKGYTISTVHSELPQPSKLKSALFKAFMGTDSLTPAYTVEIARFEESGKPPSSLRILMGDEELVHFEDELSNHHKDVMGAYQEQTVAGGNCVGAMYHLALMTAAHYKSDIVLFDLSPSMSRMNRMVLGMCDFFILPSGPDFLSRMAVDTLAKKMVPRPVVNTGNGPSDMSILTSLTLLRQKQLIAGGFDASGASKLRYPLPVPRPKLLGSFISKYHNVLEGSPANAIKVMVKDICVSVNRLKLALTGVSVPGLAMAMGEGAGGAAAGAQPEVIDFVVPDHIIPPSVNRASLLLMMMPDFTSLAAYASVLGVPAPFIETYMLRNLDAWCKRACAYYGVKASVAYFPFKKEEFVERIKLWNDGTKAVSANILSMVRDLTPVGTQLHAKLAAAAAAPAFRRAKPCTMPVAQGTLIVHPFIECFSLYGNGEVPPEEIAWTTNPAGGAKYNVHTAPQEQAHDQQEDAEFELQPFDIVPENGGVEEEEE